MTSLSRLSLVCLLLIFGFGFTTPALGAEACTCFCGDTVNGATNIEGTFSGSSDCRTACDAAKRDFVTCAADADAFPVADARCYTEAECKVVKNSDGEQAIWGSEQPYDCPGPASGTPYHYCYSAPKKAELNVAIGEQKYTLPIGDYINLIYTYALGIAAIIAVVMIMIGGAQYVIGSRGNSEEVNAAKDRIRNAVTGLVLLLFAYLVLNTVNPALIRFKVLKLPLLKPSLFLTGSCESFKEQKYTVTPDSGSKTSCGDTGKITKDPTGAAISATACTYATCSNGSLCGQVGTEYKCMTCENAGEPEYLDAGFEPSDAHCSSLSPPASGQMRNRCVYGGTVGYIEGGLTSYSIGQKFCSEVMVNCAVLKSCSDYAQIADSTHGVGFWAGGSHYTPNPDDTYAKNAVQKLCAADPCGVAAVPTVCVFNASGSTTSLGVTYPYACQ